MVVKTLLSVGHQPLKSDTGLIIKTSSAALHLVQVRAMRITHNGLVGIAFLDNTTNYGQLWLSGVI